jgi:dihydroorotase
MVMRDITLARLTGARVHFQHLSTTRSVDMVRQAKAAGLRVTCEATPHHLTLTDEACAGYDPVFRVNPPLRPADDRDGVRAGLLDGTIDAVATDHAPHDQEAKEQPFDQAPPGMLGLETALALTLGQLDLFDEPQQLFAMLSWRPAAVLDLPAAQGRLVQGAPADLCVVDPEHRWVVDPTALASRSRNTPYAGMQLQGQARHTICGGEPVVIDHEAQR